MHSTELIISEKRGWAFALIYWEVTANLLEFLLLWGL